MMKTFTPIATLVAVGLASATLWRIEVEAHGWDGLIWISYFHWAIPAGVLMFAAWLGFFSGVHPAEKRTSFSITSILFAAAAYLLAHKLAFWHEYPPFMWEVDSPIWFWLGYYAIFAYIPLVAIAFFLIAAAFRAPLSRRGTAVAFGTWLVSFPIAMLLLALVNHRGQPDMLHAIKSGFVIPFLIVSLGVPFVINNRKDKGQPSPAPDASPAAGEASGEA